MINFSRTRNYLHAVADCQHQDCSSIHQEAVEAQMALQLQPVQLEPVISKIRERLIGKEQIGN